MKTDSYNTCEKCGSKDMISEGASRYCRKCFWHPKVNSGKPKGTVSRIQEKQYNCMHCGKIMQAKSKRCLCPECRIIKQKLRDKERWLKKKGKIS